ncbi:MAG: acetate/propionate family kinase [Deltaproteobacteria bacterium]
MKILVINCGSSTVKFQLIELEWRRDGFGQKRLLAGGLVDRIGGKATRTFFVQGGSSRQEESSVQNHEQAVGVIIEWLSSIAGLGSIDAVGHRIVHGGDQFTTAVWIDDRLVEGLDSLSELAPLHNPAGVAGIRAARKFLGSAMPMVAAFDTSFHHTMPESARTYALPRELAQKHGIHRYGFHGLAHQYSVIRYGEITGTPVEQIKIVTLHLGNGCSACAVRDGVSVDTSMGFTPLEGLVMGTRSGDIDPAVVPFLARKEGVSADEVESWLNKRSGLLGLSGISNDMRELTAAYDKDSSARLAVDVFCYHARKYLGAYLAALGGADGVVFSGGIGENSPLVRAKICADMDWCGLQLDPAANVAVLGSDGCIAPPQSAVQVHVVHTDEEAIIARETARVLSERTK